jgi:hypothetical protein
MKILHEFFERYALVSISGNSGALTEFYGKYFVVTGPAGSMAFANDQKFIIWLDEVHDFNKRSGLISLKVRQIKGNTLGKHAIHASVTWGAVFSMHNNEIIDFDIHYILEDFGQGLKIILYISDEDQETLMKKHGLL